MEQWLGRNGKLHSWDPVYNRLVADILDQLVNNDELSFWPSQWQCTDIFRMALFLLSAHWQPHVALCPWAHPTDGTEWC
jgi:hypothetical protein